MTKQIITVTANWHKSDRKNATENDGCYFVDGDDWKLPVQAGTPRAWLHNGITLGYGDCPPEAESKFSECHIKLKDGPMGGELMQYTIDLPNRKEHNRA